MVSLHIEATAAQDSTRSLVDVQGGRVIEAI